jgi:hypothetical protein
MYEFEFESCMNLNLKYSSNIAIICIFQMVSADTIDPSLMSASLS